MYFIILATDKSDSLGLRMDNRPDHLSYAAAQDCVVLAGPFLSAGEDPKPQGSMFIIKVKDAAAAAEFAANDPYAKAGLFAKVTITPWRPALGPWMPEEV